MFPPETRMISEEIEASLLTVSQLDFDLDKLAEILAKRRIYENKHSISSHLIGISSVCRLPGPRRKRSSRRQMEAIPVSLRQKGKRPFIA